MSAPPGWEGLLDEGENILWQGRPDKALHIKPRAVGGAIFGLFFAGFALFWMVMASQAGGVFWMFGLLHFAIGLSIVFGALFYPSWKRRHTWYTLTNRRAFIAEDVPFRQRSLKSYPITQDTPIELRGEEFATLIFARETKRDNDGDTTSTEIGFERIAEGKRVFQLIRDIQRGETTA